MRHANWQSLFWAEIERQRARAFEYGICDCILFGAEVADAITGGGYVARARAAFTWSNEDEAKELLASHSMKDLVSTVLGDPSPWPRLRTGDLVLCASPSIEDQGLSHILCVHDGTSPIAKVHKRLLTLTWDRALCGWRID